MGEGMEGGMGVQGEAGRSDSGHPALTRHHNPPSSTLSPQGFSVQGQYGAVTPAEVSGAYSPRHPFPIQASPDF